MPDIFTLENKIKQMIDEMKGCLLYTSDAADER